jgi:hypothetical protein
MVFAYHNNEIEETLHDVIGDDDVGDGLDVPMPIIDEEVTIIATSVVATIHQQVQSEVDGFNYEDEEDKTIWQYHGEDENVAHEIDED